MRRKPRTVLEVRVDATQKTLDRFRDRPFKPGAADCVQIVKFLCRELGRPLKFGRALNYKSLLSGRAVLRRLGFATLGEALDSQFAQIAPAAALPGDIMEMPALDDPSVTGLAALVVYLGNGAVLGFHEIAVGAVVMRLEEPALRAWRTL